MWRESLVAVRCELLFAAAWYSEYKDPTTPTIPAVVVNLSSCTGKTLVTMYHKHVHTTSVTNLN